MKAIVPELRRSPVVTAKALVRCWLSRKSCYPKCLFGTRESWRRAHLGRWITHEGVKSASNAAGVLVPDEVSSRRNDRQGRGR